MCSHEGDNPGQRRWGKGVPSTEEPSELETVQRRLNEEPDSNPEEVAEVAAERLRGKKVKGIAPED